MFIKVLVITRVDLVSLYQNVGQCEVFSHYSSLFINLTSNNYINMTSSYTKYYYYTIFDAGSKKWCIKWRDVKKVKKRKLEKENAIVNECIGIGIKSLCKKYIKQNRNIAALGVFKYTYIEVKMQTVNWSLRM